MVNEITFCCITKIHLLLCTVKCTHELQPLVDCFCAHESAVHYIKCTIPKKTFIWFNILLKARMIYWIILYSLHYHYVQKQLLIDYTSI